MRIQHNILAMNAYRNYNTNTSALAKNLEKLSSGYKINRAGDDAAGLAISEKMRAQITGLNAASKNVKDGISLVKTAEGAMQEIQDMLNRMDYLATQSANGTYDNEVDRLNLQKEVNQLRSEIDRIADSANFNGIKLLDGKAGINTTGFTSFENVAGVVGSDGTVDISGNLATTTADKGYHLEGSAATQTNAEAIIDFSGLHITTANAGSTATANISLGDISFTVTLTGKTAYSASDFHTALVSAIQASTYGVAVSSGSHDSGTVTNNTGIKIGDNVYKFDTDTVGTKLTLAGVSTGGAYKAVETTPTAATNDFDPDLADTINGQLGFKVSVSGITGSTGSSGDVVHMTTQVKQAVAHKDASMAGIHLTLDTDIVKQGNKLTIDGVDFTFELNDASNTGANIINLAAESAAGQDIIHAAADKLSQQAQFTSADTANPNRTWKIGVNGDGTTIHIEQTGASATGKEIKGYDDLTKLISVSGPATNDKGAGVKIGVDPTKVAAGNKLKFTLGDKTVEVEVVESGAVASKHQINKADIASDTAWQSALGNDYTVDVVAGTGDDAGKQFVTVRSKLTTQADAAAVAASKTPIVGGTGLTLQIGDTSDKYNQLDVEIGDMHTTALGINTLDISNPEGASAAIQTIKDAINYVSGVRGDLGATQNRLEHTANNLSVMAENIQDAESTIRDTDVAEEMMAYTKNNILIQSAQAMLAQANAVPQGVLQLLG